ncbi:retrovirus-related pol polyprotein from transposon TNT 1-94 [Tanacetum coccineum]
MNTTQAQQKALDDSLIVPADRLEFGKCNMRLKTDIKPKEATFQVVLDALSLTPFYRAFLITADCLEADRLLAEKLQEQEREQFTIEERAKFLHDTIAAQRKEKSKEENVNYDYCEIETKNVELENSFKEQLDSIKKTRVRTKEQSDSLIDKLNLKFAENEDLKAQIQDKVFVITSLKNDLRKIIGKEIVDITAQIPSANTIVPGMFKLDLKPLAPRLLQNREAHIDYLKCTQEQADILREIVEQAKAEQPLDNDAKKVAVTPKNKVKKVRFAEPLTSPSNNKQVESLNKSDSNTHVLSSTGLKCSTSESRSKPTGNKRNDRISQTPSRNMENKVEAQPRKVNKKNCVVKPIHDVDVKHSLLNANSELICATCRTFTIVGNMCPLTRITSANVVPLKTTTSHSVESLIPELKVYSRKLKNVKNVASSKKVKIVESKNANNSEPNHTWGSNTTDIPSSSSSVMTVRFGNDHIARIMGYGDYQLGNVTISRVYYVEGLGHNLFSVGQFCDADLEVAFRKNTCFIRNLEGVDLLSGSRDTNLYTISLDDMLKTSPICLLSKASKTKSWLWHRRLSHLNFGTLNKLAKDGLARGIPRLKFQKDHLCSACALGKSKKSSHQPKAEDTNQEKLYLLHMDLCGPMRVASINGKRYILVIVDDYSRFTWVRFLRTKDEAPEAIIKCIKNIQVRLNATVRNIRTDDGTEFVNRTLSPLFLWAKAINKAYYTQDRSIILRRYNKTPYELMQDKKPDLSFFHVFDALCYPTNDNDDLGKLDAKSNIGIFVGYAPTKKTFKIYKKRTQKIIETIHVTFDELTAIASEQFSSGPGLKCITPATSSSELVPNPVSQQPFQEVAAPRVVVLADSPVSTFIDQYAPSSSTPSTQEQVQSLLFLKNRPIANVICDPSRSVSIRKQLQTDAMWCYFDAFLTSVEPKNFKQAMTEPSWIDAMQKEIHEFQRLEVWELVSCPDKVLLIKLKWIYKVKKDKFGGVLKNKQRQVASRSDKKKESILRNQFAVRMLE